jgi:hypoxanthine-DNA glycosylase
MVLQGFPPIIDERANMLILGSFPSVISRAAKQYYANKQNQFWRILGAILGQQLHQMEYEEKLEVVKGAGLAIWDVYSTCECVGALDANIRNGHPNNFSLLQKSAPALRQVCFNGKKAGEFSSAFADLGYETLVLPSTSPANARWSFERKLESWREGLGLGQD